MSDQTDAEEDAKSTARQALLYIFSKKDPAQAEVDALARVLLDFAKDHQK